MKKKRIRALAGSAKERRSRDGRSSSSSNRITRARAHLCCQNSSLSSRLPPIPCITASPEIHSRHSRVESSTRAPKPRVFFFLCSPQRRKGRTPPPRTRTARRRRRARTAGRRRRAGWSPRSPATRPSSRTSTARRPLAGPRRGPRRSSTRGR